MKTETRKQLTLARLWRCGDLVMRPGIYALGATEKGPRAQISMALASKAVADGAGSINTVAVEIRSRRKRPAPENKSLHAASENKSSLVGLHRGGDRPEPDARGGESLQGAKPAGSQ